MRYHLPAIAIAIAIAVGPLACGGQPAARPSPARPIVVTSVLPQAWFVRQIAGDLVDVEVMLPPGASPSYHEPAMAQLTALSRAALYIKIGHPHFPFEATWLEQLISAQPNLRVVDCTDGLTTDDEDPHVWVAPRQARAMALKIGAALTDLLPTHQAKVQTNLEALVAQIDAIDTEVRAILAPHAGQAFFVFHPAWGYFAEAYGLEQIAIEQHGKEPDARALAALIERARTLGAKTIFVQPQFAAAAAQAIASEVGATVSLLDPLAYDWDENLRTAAREIGLAAR